MKISGFSFVRNGSKLYYPVRESIESMLPLCDEIYVAVGKGDPDDTSREDIASIGSDNNRYSLGRTLYGARCNPRNTD